MAFETVQVSIFRSLSKSALLSEELAVMTASGTADALILRGYSPPGLYRPGVHNVTGRKQD